MACWLALSDTDGENGGLCVVPGSHRRGLYGFEKVRDTGEHAAWETVYKMSGPDGEEWEENMHSFDIVGLEEDEVARLSVPAGAGVFFTGMTVHGSYANRSNDRPRRAFAIHYVGAETWIYPRFTGSGVGGSGLNSETEAVLISRGVECPESCSY